MGENGTTKRSKKKFSHCLVSKKNPKIISKNPRENIIYINPRQPQQKNLENITYFSYEKISKTIKKSQTEQRKRENIQNWKNQVAPTEKILEDLYSTIKKSPMLFVDKEMSQVFSIKAIEGHAQNGHATFYRNAYPNTTTIDVLDAIEEAGTNQLGKNFSKKGFQNTTQKYIDSTVEFIQGWFKDIEENISDIDARPDSIKLKNNRKKTMNRMSCFKGMDMNMLEFARGFYMTTNMDSLKGIREDGFKKYGQDEGGGECHLTLTKKLQEYDIGVNDLSGINYQGSLEKLNRLRHKTKLQVLKKLGIIIEKTLPLEDIAQGEYTWKKIKSHPGVTDLLKNSELQGRYIRERKGYGVGDDIVIFLAGFLPPTIYNDNHKQSNVAVQSRIIGGLQGDFIDTMEKDTKLFMPGGQDEMAGLHINGQYKKLAQDPRFRKRFNIKERPDGDYNLVSHDELVDFTMAGANTEDQSIHSSQRHFYMNRNGTCAVSEILRHAYFNARLRGQEMSLSDIKNFKINLDQNFDSTKFTFEGIPLYNIKNILNERLGLVFHPKEREKNLTNYHSDSRKNTERLKQVNYL